MNRLNDDRVYMDWQHGLNLSRARNHVYWPQRRVDDAELDLRGVRDAVDAAISPLVHGSPFTTRLDHPKLSFAPYRFNYRTLEHVCRKT